MESGKFYTYVNVIKFLKILIKAKLNKAKRKRNSYMTRYEYTFDVLRF